MMDLVLPALVIALLALIPIVAHHRLARDRLLLQAALVEEERERDEAMNMRANQREQETNRLYLQGVRETQREFLRMFDDDDEPWKR